MKPDPRLFILVRGIYQIVHPLGIHSAPVLYVGIPRSQPFSHQVVGGRIMFVRQDIDTFHILQFPVGRQLAGNHIRYQQYKDKCRGQSEQVDESKRRVASQKDEIGM